MKKYYDDPNNLKRHHDDEVRRLREYYEDELQKRTSHTIQWIALIVSLIALIKRFI